MKKLSTLSGIRLVVGPIPAVFLLAGIILARFYPLSREDHQNVLQVLVSRRSEVDLDGSKKEVL
jgi:glycoside/pentoside/hexuronide:cation symporter, GPH family